MITGRNRAAAFVALLALLLGIGLFAYIFQSSPTRSTDRATSGSSPASGSQTVRAPPTRVVLTPTESPATSQSISWLAGDASHSVGNVQIRSTKGTVRTVPGAAVNSVNGSSLQHFSATVSGLDPSTSYEYRVGVEGSWSRWHTFTTADPENPTFQFVYYGDAQLGLDSTWPKVVRMAGETAPDAAGSVHAGDLIDNPLDESEWLSWFAAMGDSAASSNVMAAPGNHEYIDDSFLGAWKANFEYPRNNPTIATSGALASLAVGDSQVARQYAAYFRHWADIAAETVYFTDYQGVRFITLNPTQDDGFLTPANLPDCQHGRCPSEMVGELWIGFQASWLDQVLARSPSKWTVVTFHQPVFSTSAGRDEPVLRAQWLPILEDHNVDLVLMGHDHAYARGYANVDRTAESGVTSGPVYVVSNSGAKHYDLAPEQDNVWTGNDATQVRRGEGVTTYQVIDVTPNQLVYRSYLAEKSPEASTGRSVGSVFDEFTVTKEDDGHKRVTEAAETPRP